MNASRITVRSVLICIAFIFLSAANIKAQVVQWAKSYGGTDNEYSASIAADAAGNIYTIGTFSGTAIFGSYTLAGVASKGDIFITRTEAATGNVVWAKRFGSQAEDYGCAITTGAGGDVYCAGRFGGTLTLGGATYTANGSYDGFMAKIDAATGAVLWSQKMGGTGYDNASSIVTDATGNVYTTGNFQGTATFGTHTLTPTGTNFNVFVTRTNGATGTLLWAMGMGGTGYNFGNSITCDASGNIYTTGTMEGTAMFGSYTLTSQGNTDIFITKADAATGSITWAKNFGGPGNDSGNGIMSKGGNDIYTTGKFEGQVVFGSDTLMSYGSSDAFTIKQDGGNSNVLWAKRAGGTGYDASNALSYDALGNIYTAGQFSGVIVLNGVTYYGSGVADAYMARMNDATGQVSWGMQFGGAGADICSGLARDASGSIYVTGAFQLSSLFENITMAAAGNSDVFTLKLNAGIVGLNRNVLRPYELKVSPNPFDNELQMSLGTTATSAYTVTITDVSGRKVTELKENKPEIILDLGGLNAGIYYLSLSDGSNAPVTRKVIKK